MLACMLKRGSFSLWRRYLIVLFENLRGCSSYALLLISALLSPWVASYEDPLEVAAIKSEKAVKSLLLDITLAGNRLVAVGERGHIVYSDDNGQSWSQAEVPVITTLTSVYFPSKDQGWAVGHDGLIIHSDNGGETWQRQFDGFQANKKVLESIEEHVADLEEQMDATTDDVEREELEYVLEEVRFALDDARYDVEDNATKPLLDVWFQDDRTGFVLGAYGFLFKTNNGGRTWENWALKTENPNRFHLNAITQASNGDLFIAGEAGLLLQSTDQGESWQQLESPYQGSYFGVIPVGNQGNVIAFGLRGHAFSSVANGRSWEEIAIESDATIAGGKAAASGDIVLVGSSGLISKSVDLGNHFNTQIRRDRLSLSAVERASDGTWVIVGQGGIHLMVANGEELQASTPKF